VLRQGAQVVAESHDCDRWRDDSGLRAVPEDLLPGELGDRDYAIGLQEHAARPFSDGAGVPHAMVRVVDPLGLQGRDEVIDHAHHADAARTERGHAGGMRWIDEGRTERDERVTGRDRSGESRRQRHRQAHRSRTRRLLATEGAGEPRTRPSPTGAVKPPEGAGNLPHRAVEVLPGLVRAQGRDAP